jgi:hypothetical protein
MSKLKINIAEDFTKTPGPRGKEDGKYSGEEFYERFLLPKFKEALERKKKVEINLNHLFGLPSSFLSASFGKLSTKYSSKIVLDSLEFISDSDITKEKVEYAITFPDNPKPC